MIVRPAFRWRRFGGLLELGCTTRCVSGSVSSEVLWKPELSLLTLFGLVAVIGWQHDFSGVQAPEGSVRNRA